MSIFKPLLSFSLLSNLPITFLENHRAISQGRTIRDILIFYGMLPLPFPISFFLSFVTPWVSSLPYLPKCVWRKQAFAPCTTLIYSFPSLQGHYQIELATAKNCSPLFLRSYLTVFFFILFVFHVAVKCTDTVSSFLGVTKKVFLKQPKTKNGLQDIFVRYFHYEMKC